MKGQKKITFLARLLPAAGLLLILPPMVSIPNANPEQYGFAAVIIYLFSVWLFLIFSAYILQRKLDATPPEISKQYPLQPIKTISGSSKHD